MRKVLVLVALGLFALLFAVGTVSAGSEQARGRPWQLGYCECGLCQTDDNSGEGNQALFDPLCDPPGQGFVPGLPKSVNHGWCLGYLHLAGAPAGVPAPNWP